MSAHTFGGGNEPPRQQKAETIRLGLISDVRTPDILKPNKQANIKASMTGVRSIAPSPGISTAQVQHPLVSATQLLGGSSVQTSISSKLASAINLVSGAAASIGEQQNPPTAVTLTPSQTGVGSVAQIRTISSQQQQQNLIQAAVLGSQNYVKLHNSVGVPMASIIKSGNPVVPNQHQIQSQQQSQTNPIHQFAAHIPRGPATVSQLTTTKGTAVATPVLRPTQPLTAGQSSARPQALQLPASLGGSATLVPGGTQHGTLVPGGTQHGTLVPGSAQHGTLVPGSAQHGTLQQRAILPVRGHTPPGNTRPASPAVVHQLHTEGQKSSGASVPTTIQISVQQQRNTVEVHTRPMQQQQLGVGKPQPVSQLNQTSQPSQKVVMSQSGVTPMMQTSSIQTPLTIAGQKIVNPSPGMLINPMRQPKVIATQPAQLANIPGQGNATAYTLSGARTSKIIVTQAINPHNPQAGTIISAIPRGSNTGNVTLPRQQHKMVAHPTNTIAAMTTTVTTMTSKGVAHISLQGGHRPQTSTASSSQGLVTTTPIAKIPPQKPAPTVMASHQTNLAHLQQQQHATVQQLQQQQQQAETAHSLRVSSTSHHHQQQQQPSQQQQHYLQHSQGGTNVSVASMFMNKSSGGVMVTQAQHQSQQQPHHQAPHQAPHQAHMQATGQQPGIPDPSRPQDSVRMSNIPMFSIPAEMLNNPALTSIYHQAIAANNLRTMAGQGSNLTATLQGSGHGTSVTVTGTHTQPSLRVNNNSNAVMVTVDPSRHNLHNTQQSIDTKGLKQEVVVATMASTHLNAAMATGAHHPGNQQTSGNAQVTNTLTSSPRPSILRKRNSEGLPLVKRQILGGPPPSEHSNSSHDLPTSLPGAAISPKPSTLDAANENSQSSTDTASSTQSTPQSKRSANTDHRHKHDHPPLDHSTALENGHIGSMVNSTEASPRKRPRKQLLPPATEEVKETITDTDAEEEIQKFSEKVYSSRELEKQQQEEAEQEELQEFVDEDGVRWIREKKRPPIALLSHYQCSWKPKNNHFLRHSDVKPKEERRPTVNELANQKHIVQKSSGWKLYHLAAQIEELMDAERLVLDKMILVQDQVAPKHIAKTTMEDDIGMVHELSQGNIQRSQLFADQMQEARTALVKILDHKRRIGDIVTKHHSKRPVKKKER